ncbi:hypothetical protein PFICI_00387 [Pestalotiopsis fici W106-1]|uniref:Uncharacterized protein n=1 Tax=Pestalotiopsis fici (strain W106-1 / CGMCC3.15140) TaxID=1229662 RepID=W3XKL7_PESFW|nr:uncharacterized protein PFICI_00387 [Pestalotiopsis fici W106-1]ETS86559.1 hypothetical protein PFICI_00387 [Pestalotiopsis fici W106-1]
MAMLSEFRYFRRLPRELQEMVWKHWEASKPVVRHYFFADKSTRSYVAIDPARRVPTKSLTAHKGHNAMRLDPSTKTVFHKIRFSGKVRTTGLETPLHDMWDLSSGSWAKAAKYPTCAHVNFDRDVFVFQNIVPNNMSPFQFLAVPISRYSMSMGKVHLDWVRRIQHVAYYPPPDKRGYFLNWSATPAFVDALRAMESLKTLYIVKRPQKNVCNHGALSRWKISPHRLTKGHHHDAGFIMLQDFVAEHRRLDAQTRPNLMLPPPPTSTTGNHKPCKCEGVNAGRGAVDVSQAITRKLGTTRVAQINIVDVVDPLYPGI